MESEVCQVIITLEPEVKTQLAKLAEYYNIYEYTSLLAYCVSYATRHMEAEKRQTNWRPAKKQVVKPTVPAANPPMPPSETYVLDYLREHGATLLGDLKRNAVNCTESGAKFAVYRLLVRGLVARVDGGGAGSRATYNLAPINEQP